MTAPDSSMASEPPGHPELIALLGTLTWAGDVAPCVNLPAAAWVDDDADNQQYAARLCRWCPALETCRAYGLANPGEAGVYGGLTEQDRRGGRRRRRARVQ